MIYSYQNESMARMITRKHDTNDFSTLTTVDFSSEEQVQEDRTPTLKETRT